MSNNRGNNVLTTLLVAAASAGVALLFAPKSGKELRQDIKKKAEEAGEQGRIYAENLAQDIKESVQEVEAEAQADKEVFMGGVRNRTEIDKQELAYTDQGEITAIDKPSGDISDTIYDPRKDTIDANRPGGQADRLTTASGEVTYKDRAHGNITGTKFDAGRNITIPADGLDQALEDAGVDEK